MARLVITNFRDLKDEIRFWLNRADLDDRLNTFVYLAERKIFRRLRCPSNEKTVEAPMRADPVYGSSSNEVILSDRIDLPQDYLECLTLTINGEPATRISLTEMQRKKKANQDQPGVPRWFCRERAAMVLDCTPAGDTDVVMIYYNDLSGTLVEDEDDNDVLWIAPDLYLYGALMEAVPFIKPEDLEFRLIPIWQGKFEEGFAGIELQRDEDERSGSNVEVKSAYHDSSRGRLRR